jgi:RNA polymerase sigma-70 factor (ECF subfamily)
MERATWAKPPAVPEGQEDRVSQDHRPRFETLYDAHFEAIFRFVLYRVGNVAEAEDVTSQVFFKALRGYWRFRWLGGSAAGWLYRIASNEVTSHFRRSRPERSLDEEPTGARALVLQEAAEAEQILSRNEIFAELTAALRRLKPDDQTLVVLRYLEDKPFREIAAIVKKRTGTVTMRTHRALRKLKRELERRGVDHERFREGFAEAVPPTVAGGPVQANLTP